MSNDSIKKTIVVALGVCFVCSILVATAAVSLKARQDKNRKLDKIKNILQAGDLYQKGQSSKEIFEIFSQKVQPHMLDIETGQFLPEEKYDDVLNPENYDIKTVAKHKKYGMKVPDDKDIAGIKRMPKYVLIYYIKDKDQVGKLVLPLYGKGLWSTMYGFIALDRDLKTVKGFTFYEHGETPGLGGEVDNPKWKAQWNGKSAFDDNLELRLTVIKGIVDKSRSEAIYQIDGLSGSTLTTDGIRNLVKFWLGENVYGPFFKKLREEGING